MNAKPLGPAFDSNTLIKQTQRKLVTLWMEQAGADTLIVPAAWAELTRDTATRPGMTAARRWKAMEHMPNSPFLLLQLTEEQDEMAEEIRHTFTEACFPQTSAHDIPFHNDAVIISQALALGTDALITNNMRSIDHRAINDVIRSAFRLNTGYVLTLDAALMDAFPDGESAEQLLKLALATTAPASPQQETNLQQEWTLEQAHEDLTGLCRALEGANMPDTASRLDTRWHLARDLDAVVAFALATARESNALRWERMRGALGQPLRNGPPAAMPT